MDKLVRIRTAVAADAVGIREMNLAFNECDVTAESIAEKLGMPSAETVLVAEDGDALAGFAAVQIQSSICYDEAWAELTELYVEPPARRSGVGRALVSEIERLVKQSNARSLFVRTSGRVDRRAFYLAFGMIESTQLVFEKSLEGR